MTVYTLSSIYRQLTHPILKTRLALERWATMTGKTPVLLDGAP